MKNIAFSGVCLLALFAYGCGGGGTGGPELHPVKGKVTKGGAPAKNIVVTFVPEDPKMPRPSGAVDENGEFVLIATANQPGATAGPHKVVLAFSAGEAAYGTDSKGPPKAPFEDSWLSAETSELTIDVPEGGKKDVLIELP